MGLPHAAVCALLLGPVAAWAGDWTFTRGIGVSAEYSDNIALSASAPQSDLVTQVSPTLSLEGAGRRATVSLSYSPSGLAYLKNSSADGVRHNLNANGLFQLVEDTFYLNARFGGGNRTIDISRASGDALNLTGNTTQSWAGEINPYLRLHHGNFATSTLSLTSNLLTYNSSSARDSTGLGATYALNSGPEFARVPWNLSLNWRKVGNQSAANQATSNDVTQSYLAQVGYLFNREWRADVRGGWENNALGSGYGSGKGIAWGTSVTWTPNERTNGSLSYAQQPFGDTWSTAISHRSRHSVFGLGYDEALNSARNSVLGTTLATPQEIAGLLVPGLPTGTPGSGALLGQLFPGLPNVPSLPTLPTLPTPGSGALLGQAFPNLPTSSSAIADQILGILVPGLPTQSAQAVEQALQLFSGSSPSLNSGNFLEKRLSLRYGLNTGRTAIGLSLMHTERISAASGQPLVGNGAVLNSLSGQLATRISNRIANGGAAPSTGAGLLRSTGLLSSGVSALLAGTAPTETVNTASLSISRQIGPHVSGQLSTSWQQTDQGTARASQIAVAAALSRRLSTHTTAAVRVQHATRNAGGTSTDSYRENRISLTVSASW